MAALRVFLKRLLDNPRFCLVWLNGSRFGIIHIAERRKARPFAPPEFLANPALYILRQIVGIIFGLAKGDLKHKQPLRSWLKPECRKAQRSYFGGVYGVNYQTAINRISGETIRVPRKKPHWSFTFLHFAHHLVKNFSPWLLCAFAFNKGFG